MMTFAYCFTCYFFYVQPLHLQRFTHKKFMLKSLSLKTEFYHHGNYGDFSCSVLRNLKNQPVVLKWSESDITKTLCKETIPKIRNKYFQKRNCTASVQFPHSFVCERYVYSQDRVCLFCCRKICGPILGIYKSLTDT